MSWQQYVDQQLVGTGNVTSGAICGQDGSIWATSPGFISADEAKTIVGQFGSSELPMKGLMIGGEKFFYLSGSDEIMRGKKGQMGVHISKSQKAVIVALYKEPIQPGQCANTVEALADYLKSMSY